MRRYTFYLMVALLAFGIGSFVVFNFYLKHIEQSIITQTTKTNSVSNTESKLNAVQKKTNENKADDTKEIVLKNLPCDDKNLQLVWNELKDETASVSAETAKEIKSCSDIIEIDEPADLNNDGRKEIVIRGWRSPYRVGGDGVTFWIFQKVNQKNYKKLFEGKGSFFNLKNTKTKGYRDILSNFRYNSAEYDYIIYKFNGTKYVPKKCWEESSLYKNRDGELVAGKKLKIIPYKCKESE